MKKNKVMLDYLYYKLYRASRVGSMSDIAEFIAIVNLSLLISINIFVIYGFLVKIDILSSFYSNGHQPVGVFLAMVLIGWNYFFRKKRFKKIIKKYSQESESERILGNIIVWIYVIITIISIYVVAFYKPGYLGKG